MVVERASFAHGEEEPSEDDRQREHGVEAAPRSARERAREPREERDGEKVRDRAQIELVALEDAEDGERRRAVAAVVAERDACDQGDERHREASARRRHWVDEPRRLRGARRERATKRREERERASRIRGEHAERARRQLEARRLRGSVREHALSHVRHRHAPRERRQNAERRDRRRSRALEHRLRADPRQLLADGERLFRVKKHREHAEQRADDDADRREHREIRHRQRRERRRMRAGARTLGRARLDQRHRRGADTSARRRQEDPLRPARPRARHSAFFLTDLGRAGSRCPSPPAFSRYPPPPPRVPGPRASG